MAEQVQIRRATTAQLATVTPALAEAGYDITKKTLIVGDGATLGGIPMAREDAVMNISRRYNPIFNGQFESCQRGFSQTTSGYGSDDCWLNEHNGSSKVHDIIPLNDLRIPGNPFRLSRTVVTSVAGVGNYVRKTFRIQNVRKFAGKRVSLMFWGSADAPKNIAVELVQNFGTGGSPSASVSGIGAQLIPLTTDLSIKRVALFDVPAVNTKTIGSNEDSYLEVVFWFDAGSNFNTRTNSLGQQSGTFYLSNIHMLEGDGWAPLVDSYPRMETPEVEYLCMARFVRLQGLFMSGARALNGGVIYQSWTLPAKMVKTPVGNTSNKTGANTGALAAPVCTTTNFYVGVPIVDGALQGGFGSALFDIDLSADI